jgi:threonine/homoserine/homoserine lactone efflux protein
MDVAWWLFILASLVLIVTPGQDMVLVMSRSIAQGAPAGVSTAAGVSVGLGAGMLSGRLRAQPRVLTGLYRTRGAVPVGLGVKLALECRD